jgi:hypothetical protein
MLPAGVIVQEAPFVHANRAILAKIGRYAKKLKIKQMIFDDFGVFLLQNLRITSNFCHFMGIARTSSPMRARSKSLQGQP